jgi:hypothetical protein
MPINPKAINGIPVSGRSVCTSGMVVVGGSVVGDITDVVDESDEVVVLCVRVVVGVLDDVVVDGSVVVVSITVVVGVEVVVVVVSGVVVVVSVSAS